MKIIIEVSIEAKVVTSEDNKNEIILVPVIELDQDQEVPSPEVPSTKEPEEPKELVQDTKETGTTSSNGRLVTCKADDCEQPVARKGLCDKHYMATYRQAYEPSIEARMIVERWRDHPDVDYRDRYHRHWCKVLDDLHRIDKLSWEEIRRIIDFALDQWVPRYMQSPTKLRQSSRAYPEKKCWEIIRGQINGQTTGDPSDASAFVDDINFA